MIFPAIFINEVRLISYMKIELEQKEMVVLRFLVQRELECVKDDEDVPDADLGFLGSQEAYHQILEDLAKKIKK